MRLLFAEDDRDLSTAVKALLERSGYVVDVVFDGAEAVDYAAAENYDGIIMDWMMPEMDGVEALKKIRASGSNVPCMLLTARDAFEDRITGLDAGADDYLPKPFNAGELLARVRAMLRRRENYVPDTLRFEDLTLDKGSCELSCGGRSVRLTGKASRFTVPCSARWSPVPPSFSVSLPPSRTANSSAYGSRRHSPRFSGSSRPRRKAGRSSYGFPAC